MAKQLGISRTTFFREYKAGRIPGVMVGKRVKFLPSIVYDAILEGGLVFGDRRKE